MQSNINYMKTARAEAHKEHLMYFGSKVNLVIIQAPDLMRFNLSLHKFIYIHIEPLKLNQIKK